MNAVIYARFSPRPDAPECDSITKQVDDCRRWCKEHKYQIAAEHSDKALSGADAGRPGLWDAIACLCPGTALVVRSVDRLARDRLLYEEIKRSVERRKSKIIAIESGGEVNRTPETELVSNILGDIAVWQRAVTRARTSAAMRRHQSAGRSMGGNAPYGYRIVAGRLVECPQELKAAAMAQSLRDQGMTIRQIGERLTELDYQPRGKTWHPSAVLRLLTQREIDTNAGSPTH
jgi:site-specific DNA recombinase